MRTVAALALAVALSACDHGDPAPRLGAPCECDTYPCALAECGAGALCTAGTCAMYCERDEDCPDGAVCNTDGPRACVYPCTTADECPAGLDRCDGACYGGPLVTR